MSLKNTIAADRTIPTPNANKNRYIIGMMESRIVQRIGTLVRTMTINRAKNDNPKFTKLESVLETGKTYLGRLTFLIMAAPPRIEPIDMVVASLKKPYIIWPLNR